MMYILVTLPCIFTSTTCSSAAALVTQKEVAAATQRVMPIQQSFFGSFQNGAGDLLVRTQVLLREMSCPCAVAGRGKGVGVTF